MLIVSCTVAIFDRITTSPVAKLQFELHIPMHVVELVRDSLYATEIRPFLPPVTLTFFSHAHIAAVVRPVAVL